jgi:hypothetical protein
MADRGDPASKTEGILLVCDEYLGLPLLAPFDEVQQLLLRVAVVMDDATPCLLKPELTNEAFRQHLDLWGNRRELTPPTNAPPVQ